MLDASQLSEFIIKPALTDIHMLSDQVVSLLLFTCAVESHGGSYIKQLEGPALGIYQMEPATYNDIWTNYIAQRQGLKLQLLYNFQAPIMQDEQRLMYDLRYATVMAAIFYMRVEESIPKEMDFISMWDYYKKHYNTINVKADKNKAFLAWNEFVKPTRPLPLENVQTES
jgi:hypothetical protein